MGGLGASVHQGCREGRGRVGKLKQRKKKGGGRKEIFYRAAAPRCAQLAERRAQGGVPAPDADRYPGREKSWGFD